MMGWRMMWGNLSAGIIIIVAVILLTGFVTDELQANWKYAGDAFLENESGHALEAEPLLQKKISVLANHIDIHDFKLISYKQNLSEEGSK